ncbi:LppP/LprE family lipoprotein [Corynebacterium cystitidis]|uniref:LppP/LprE lipoprotein n=1 Tax=Corynebacterium cystitidis DSM 20524 TaxID=1121357 RepID=A0A1H9P0W1_9CORY|nr:LppP/LprE family lipoprotein [Corynebacterium cystitidis]WJY82655.1 hypothetical protein CCYS_08695 [Corynebacterium cystitidis DSM 20524]SER41924.1 LppP/LprE lipoprotein [Corynebacterium cystitidis DSM 20524]SNV72230.1 Uncharacterised protein [Corynebacterium cystitidis]
MSAVKAWYAGVMRATSMVAAGLLLSSCGQFFEQPVAEPTAVLTEVSTVVAAPEGQPEETRQGSSSSTAVETQTETVTQKPNTSSECGTMSANQALITNVGKVRRVRDYPWDTDYSYTEGYDPCAALSWITITVEGVTGSSPNHIMLFHKGDYLGTATYEAYGFFPRVTRASDNMINVVYTYPLTGEGTANASGRAYASFEWDEDLQKVQMYGDVPPK